MSKQASNAASAVRMASPVDVREWQRLDADPSMASEGRALLDATVSLAMQGRDADVQTLAGLASLAAARVYLSLPADVRTVQYAARAAVRFARQTLASVVPDATPLDFSDPDVRVRLENWQATRPDSIAQTNDVREAFRALLARGSASLPWDLEAAWNDIADAWLGHDARHCERCQGGNVRPGTLSLATVRAHVAGIATESAAWKQGKRVDGRTLTEVTRVLAPFAGRIVGETVRRGAHAPAFPSSLPVGVGSVLALVYGEAWSAVERGDSRDYAAPVVPVREAREVSRLSYVSVPVQGPREVGTYAFPLDALGYDGSLGYAADVLGYDGSLGYGGYGRARVVRDVQHATLRDVRTVRVSPLPSPDVSVVRVAGVARPMSEAEANVKPVRLERFAPMPGEYVDGQGTRRNVADVSATTGMLKSFPTRVSPRKRAPKGAVGGPTVPGMLGGVR